MNDSKTARLATQHPRLTSLIVLAGVIAAVFGDPGYQSLLGPTALAPHGVSAQTIPTPAVPQEVSPRRRRAPHRLPPLSAMPSSEDRGAFGQAEGALPPDVTIFDDQYPGVANLDPGLLQALYDAAAVAAEEGVTFYVNSGWRSPEYQNRLLREAISEYGSTEEAVRWVATVDTSPHVSGDAVDIGHDDATAWLSTHGARFGLCQIYRNEPWHFELRPETIRRGCPPLFADPTHDPRMQS